MSTGSHSPPDTASPGAALGEGWRKFKRGELIPYRVMAVLLILLAAGGFVLYVWYQSRTGESKKWLDLETAGTTQELEKIVSDYPDTPPALLAEFHLARHKLGPDGIDKLVTGDPTERKKALASIQDAKDIFERQAPNLKESPVLLAECYLGLAKAELALIGITNEKGGVGAFRGSPAAAADWLEKLAALADGTPWGDDAKKQADDLRAPGGAAAQDVIRVQTSLYNMALFPARPGGNMFGPGGGMPFGPGGGMPFGPGGLPPGFPMGGPPGTVPGLPGGPVPPLPPGHP